MSDYIDITGRYYKFIVYNYLTNNGIRIVPRSCTLTEFLNHNIILNNVAIPGDKTNTVCHIFSEVGRLLFINLLQLFKDLFESNLCLVTLNPDDLIVLLEERNAIKFRQGLSYVAASENMINKNFAMLAGIIDNTVLVKYQDWVGEIDDLLSLLRLDGFQNMELIFTNTCLLDLCEKKDAFARAHSFMTRLKVYNPIHYEEVLTELVFRPDWETPVRNNDYLLECYDARKMDNMKKVKALRKAGGVNQQKKGQPALIIGPNPNTSQLPCSHGGFNQAGAGLLKQKHGTAPPNPSQSTSRAQQTHPQQNKGKAPAPPPPPTQQTKKVFVQKYNLPGCDPREEVLVFYRNVGVHGMDRSMKRWKERYGLRGLNLMLLSTLPHLSSSLMRALHRRGYLGQVCLPKILK